MIDSLRGTVIHKGSNYLVIECAGVGYKCSASLTCLSALPQTGGELRIFTHMSVKEDSVDLYGFYDRKERESFRILTTVPKVGAKVALAILSALSPEALELAIASGDHKKLTLASGVGDKLASRIVNELKDKISFDGSYVSAASSGGTAASPGTAGEAVAALVELGFDASSAAAAVSKCDTAAETGEIIKQALKLLYRA